MRSTPSTIHSNKRKAMTPRAIAKMSMAVTIDRRASHAHDDPGIGHNDFVTGKPGECVW
jgi:hypothetical protein